MLRISVAIFRVIVRCFIVVLISVIVENIPVAVLRPGVLSCRNTRVVKWPSKLDLVRLLVVAVNVETRACDTIARDPIQDAALAFLHVQNEGESNGQELEVGVDTST